MRTRQHLYCNLLCKLPPIPVNDSLGRWADRRLEICSDRISHRQQCTYTYVAGDTEQFGLCFLLQTDKRRGEGASEPTSAQSQLEAPDGGVNHGAGDHPKFGRENALKTRNYENGYFMHVFDEIVSGLINARGLLSPRSLRFFAGFAKY